MTTSPGASSARPEARFVETVVLPVPPFGDDHADHVPARACRGPVRRARRAGGRRRRAPGRTRPAARRRARRAPRRRGPRSAARSRGAGSTARQRDDRDVGAVGVERLRRARGRRRRRGPDRWPRRPGRAGELGDDRRLRWPRAGRPASSGGDRPACSSKTSSSLASNFSDGLATRRSLIALRRRVGREPDAAVVDRGDDASRGRPGVRAKVTRNLPVGAVVTSFLFGLSPLLPSICTLVTSTLRAMTSRGRGVAGGVRRWCRSPTIATRSPARTWPPSACSGSSETVLSNMPARHALAALHRADCASAETKRLARSCSPGSDVDRGDVALERRRGW